MSCPECGKESKQQWESGYSGTHDTPAEPAGWRCLHCEAVYSDSDDGYGDWKYEDWKDQQEQRKHD